MGTHSHSDPHSHSHSHSQKYFWDCFIYVLPLFTHPKYRLFFDYLRVTSLDTLAILGDDLAAQRLHGLVLLSELLLQLVLAPVQQLLLVRARRH